MMELGEVYVSLEKGSLKAGECVLVVLQTFNDHDDKYPMVECLVLLDETNCSLYGPGSTDEWMVSQLYELFEKLT